MWSGFILVVSYLFSYAAMVTPLRDMCVGLWKIALTAKTELATSAVCRVAVIFGAMNLLQTMGVANFDATPWASAAIANTSVSIGCALAVSLGFLPLTFFAKNRIRKDGVESEAPRHDPGMRKIIKFDQMMWAGFVHMIRTHIFLQTCQIMRDPDMLFGAIVAFEENKEAIVQAHRGKYTDSGKPRWLYMIYLTEDQNSQRVEALVNVVGMRRLNKRIKELRQGTNETTESVALRRNLADSNAIDTRPRPDFSGWVDNPELFCEYHNDRDGDYIRKCESFVYEWLQYENAMAKT